MRGIASGCLKGDPIEKTSKNENSYLLATIVEKVGNKKRWVKAFIFDASACEEVRRLSDGDPIAVAGEIDASIYQPDSGEARVNWSIMVDGVISARRKPKTKREAADRNDDAPKSSLVAHNAPADGRAYAARSWAAPQTGGAVALNDDVPFSPEWR